MTDTDPPPLFARSPEELPDRTRLLSMSGLEFMQAMLDGRLPHPPISALLNYRLHEVAPGRVAFAGTPLFDHLNPMGSVHGGWYGTLLDSAMACAVMTLVPRGFWYTTLEYKVNITRALPSGTAAVARAEVRHSGRRTAVADAVLRCEAQGRVYATASTTCIILDGA